MIFPKSLALSNIWAPAPTTSRTDSTPLSAHPDGTCIAHVAGSSVYVRSIDQPNWAKKFDEHKTVTKVARFSPSGHYIASGDQSGTVKVWGMGQEDSHDHRVKASHDVFVGEVTDIAWDADSQRILAVGAGKNTSGKCIMYDTGNSLGDLITGHSSRVISASIRPKRPFRAITADEHGIVAFHNGPPIKPNKVFNDIHSSRVLGAAFSPNGDHFVTVSAIPNSKIALQSLDSAGNAGAPRLYGEGKAGHSGTVTGVSWASDSTRFVTSSADRTIRIWDVETGANTETFTADPNISYTERFHGQQVGLVWLSNRSDQMIVSVDLAGNFHHFTPGNPKSVRTVFSHRDFITTVATDNDNAHPTFYTGGSEGRVLSWDMTTDSPDAMPVGKNILSRRVTAILPSPTISQKASAKVDTNLKVISWDDDVRSFNCDNGTPSFLGDSIPLGSQAHSSARVVAEGSGGQGYTVSLLTSKSELSVVPDNGTESTNIILPGIKAASATALAGWGSWIVVGDNNGHLWSYTLVSEGGKDVTVVPFAEPTTKASLRKSVALLQFSPDGSHLAAGGAGGVIFVFQHDYTSPSSPSIPAEVTLKVTTNSWIAHAGTITALQWHPEGRILASGSVDMSIRVWTLDDLWARAAQSNAVKEQAVGFVWRKEPKGDVYSLISVSADSSMVVWKMVN